MKNKRVGKVLVSVKKNINNYQPMQSSVDCPNRN